MKTVEVKAKFKGKHGKKGGSRGKVAKDLLPKWVNYAPQYPVKKVLNLYCDNWLTFCKEVFLAVGKAHGGVLPLLRAAYQYCTLLIEGWINKSKDHKKTDKALIDKDTAFKEFTEAALAIPSNVKMGLKLVHPKNPKDDEEGHPHLYNFYTHYSQVRPAASDDSKEEDTGEECSVRVEFHFDYFLVHPSFNIINVCFPSHIFHSRPKISIQSIKNTRLYSSALRT